MSSAPCSSDSFTIQPHHELAYDEFIKMVMNSELQLFDVREPNECLQTGIIPGAVNIPLGRLGEELASTRDDFQEKYKLKMPDKSDTNVVFYCRSGNRSKRALATADAAGFHKCRHYIGGILEWASKQEQK